MSGKRELEYIKNAGKNAKIEYFVEDFSPIGYRILQHLKDSGLINLDINGNISLSESGEKQLNTK